MSDAPERICATGWDRDPTARWWHWPPISGGVEYIRADIYTDAIARAERVENRVCQLGDDCDLTVAWMAGQQEAKDSAKARIEQLQFQLGVATLDAQCQRERATAAELERHGLRDLQAATLARAERAEALLKEAVEALRGLKAADEDTQDISMGPIFFAIRSCNATLARIQEATK